MCKKLLAFFLRILGAFTTLESQTSSLCAAWARMIMVPPSTPAHTQNAVTPLIQGTTQGVGVMSAEFTWDTAWLALTAGTKSITTPMAGIVT